MTTAMVSARILTSLIGGREHPPSPRHSRQEFQRVEPGLSLESCDARHREGELTACPKGCLYAQGCSRACTWASTREGFPSGAAGICCFWGAEATAMAGAVVALLLRVPLQPAAHVGAVWNDLSVPRRIKYPILTSDEIFRKILIGFRS